MMRREVICSSRMASPATIDRETRATPRNVKGVTMLISGV